MKNAMKYLLYMFLITLVFILPGCGILFHNVPVDAPTPSPEADLDVPSEQLNTEEKTFTVTCNEFLTLREYPSKTAESVERLMPGAEVELIGFDGMFAHVRNDNNIGYVLSGYLQAETSDFQDLLVVKPTNIYTYKQMMDDLKTLEKLYPENLDIESAGTSVQGRDIPVVILGNKNASHHVLIQAGIHGREHMTCLLTIAQIEYCLLFYDKPYANSTISNLLNDVCLHIFPMVNPDGVTISQLGYDDDMIRNIYENDVDFGYIDIDISYEDYLKEWKSNALGIDINRNFNADWDATPSRLHPSSYNYKGVKPEDQPETKALTTYTKSYPFDATISYHAYGSCIYWEFGNDGINDISKELALAVSEYTGYTLESSEALLAGGYRDWVLEQLSIPSLTIEIGTRECPLPIEEFSTIWERNKMIFPTIARWIINGT